MILSRYGLSSEANLPLIAAGVKAAIRVENKLNTLLKTKRAKFMVRACLSILVSISVIYTPLVSATQRIVVNKAQIQVDDQSQRTQQQALKKALRQVIIKLSGSADVITNPGVKAALSSPQSFLRSYRFGFEGDKTFYIAEFDQAKLSALLQREMLPLWGAVRPETIVWIAEEREDGSRTILDESSVSTLNDTLEHTAKERGVPISFPLMDLTDSVNITTFDVWGRFVEPLRFASTRYATDNIIGARIYKNDPSIIPELPEHPVPSGTVETLENALAGEEQEVSLLSSEQQANTDDIQQNTFEQSTFEQTAIGDNQQSNSNVLNTDSTNGEQPNDGASNNNETAYENEDEAGAPIVPFTMDEFAEHAKRAEEGDYALDWVFIGKSNVSYGSIYGDTPETLAAQLIDAYSNYLSSLYAVVGIVAEDREIISISVANVGTINSYAKASKYLNNLSVVENATLTQQQGTVATFSVTLLGTVDDFLNSLRLESAMKPVTDAYGQQVEALNFYWSQ